MQECDGCKLGFHDPVFHNPPTEEENEEYLQGLENRFTTVQDVTLGIEEGLLTYYDGAYLLTKIGDRYAKLQL